MGKNHIDFMFIDKNIVDRVKFMPSFLHTEISCAQSLCLGKWEMKLNMLTKELD